MPLILTLIIDTINSLPDLYRLAFMDTPAGHFLYEIVRQAGHLIWEDGSIS